VLGVGLLDRSQQAGARALAALGRKIDAAEQLTLDLVEQHCAPTDEGVRLAGANSPGAEDGISEPELQIVEFCQSQLDARTDALRARLEAADPGRVVDEFVSLESEGQAIFDDFTAALKAETAMIRDRIADDRSDFHLALAELNQFKHENRLTRSAHYETDPWKQYSLLLFVFVGEIALNGSQVARYLQGGFVQGASFTALISFFIIFAGLVAGLWSRGLWYRRPIIMRILMGILLAVLIAGCAVFAAVLALTAAHARLLAETGAETGIATALSSVWTNPGAILSHTEAAIVAATNFFAGFGFSFWKGLHWFDIYPYYTRYDMAQKSASDRYDRARHAARQAIIKIAEEFEKRLDACDAKASSSFKRASAYAALRESAISENEVELRNAENVCRRALDLFRTANLTNRGDGMRPRHFDVYPPLTPPPPIRAAQSVSRDEVRNGFDRCTAEFAAMRSKITEDSHAAIDSFSDPSDNAASVRANVDAGRRDRERS
jgi:hypothetical protein